MGRASPRGGHKQPLWMLERLDAAGVGGFHGQDLSLPIAEQRSWVDVSSAETLEMNLHLGLAAGGIGVLTTPHPACTTGLNFWLVVSDGRFMVLGHRYPDPSPC